MLILLIVIGILANVLTGAADISFLKWKKRKETEKNPATGQIVAIFICLMMLSAPGFAQDSAGNVQAASTIAGLSTPLFYTMIAIVFLELSVILVLLVNVRFLIRSQKEKLDVIDMDHYIFHRFSQRAN